MAIRLIGIDIDGTLVNSQTALTQATIDAIGEAAEAGVQVVISTGRFLSEYTDLLAALPMIRYTVSCTGAQVIDLQTGRDIYRKALTADQMRQIYQILQPLDAMIQLFSDHDGLIHNRAADLASAERFCSPFLAAMARSSHAPEENLDAFAANYTGLTNKVHVFFADLDHRDLARTRLERLPFDLLSSMANDLELMCPGVDKGLGLQKVAEHLGLDRTEILALGDGDNDIAMLQYAGLGVAMRNASPGAKAAADRVLPYTNDEDGVAYAIRAVLRGELP